MIKGPFQEWGLGIADGDFSIFLGQCVVDFDRGSVPCSLFKLAANLLQDVDQASQFCAISEVLKKFGNHHGFTYETIL